MKAAMKWECRFITPEGEPNDMDIDLDVMDRSVVTWGLKLNAGKDELITNAGSQEQRNEWMHAIKEMVSTPAGKYRERMFTALKSYDSRRPKRATVVRRKTRASMESMDMIKAEEAAEEARVAGEDAEVLLQTPSHHKGVFGQVTKQQTVPSGHLWCRFHGWARAALPSFSHLGHLSHDSRR